MSTILGADIDRVSLLKSVPPQKLTASITFTFDGNPDTRQSTLSPDLSLVNHDKYAKLGKIAVEFKRYQEVSPAWRISMKADDLAIHFPCIGTGTGVPETGIGRERKCVHRRIVS
jgi:hypothetical protein